MHPKAQMFLNVFFFFFFLTFFFCFLIVGEIKSKEGGAKQSSI
jgi:hypothetical protein